MIVLIGVLLQILRCERGTAAGDTTSVNTSAPTLITACPLRIVTRVGGLVEVPSVASRLTVHALTTNSERELRVRVCCYGSTPPTARLRRTARDRALSRDEEFSGWLPTPAITDLE